MASLKNTMRKSRILVVVLSIVLALMILQLSVHAYTHRQIQPAKGDQPLIWYFAYGSNMSTRYLSNIRNVSVIESKQAVLYDHQVRFSLSGIQPIEPGFAALHEATDHISYGVAHQIPTTDFERVIASEGDDYYVKQVTLTLPNGEQINATTLVSKTDPLSDIIPSQRYLNILIEGATEHQLPEKYVKELRGYDGAYIPILSELFGSVIYLSVMIASG